MRLRWRRLTVLALAGGLLALSVWHGWPRERLLLQRATRVADADDFIGWAPPHGLLRLDLPFVVDADNPPILTHFDLATGKSRSFDLRHCPDGTHTHVLPSPDGRWALYWDGNGSNSSPVMAMHLQTGRCLTWASRGDSYHNENLWMADSHRWLQVTTLPDGYLTIYSLDNPAKSLRLSFPDYAAVKWQDYVLTPQDHLLTYKFDGEDDPNKPPHAGVTIREYRLLPRVAFLRTWHVAAPAGQENAWPVFSPTGDRIAWLHRWIPALPAKPQWRLSLWVSRLDGTDLQEIGHIGTNKNKQDGPEVDPQDEDYYWPDTAWLPDGKRLSFIYKDALYTVPAD